jgi:phosphate transport system permease protein
MKARRPSLIRGLSLGFTALTLLGLLAALGLLIWQSLPAWNHEGLALVTGSQWFYRHERFGATPMVMGSLIVASIALLLAAPMGLGAAVFTAEFLPERLRLPVKIAIELLAGVPSVVYGLLGILILRPLMLDVLQPFDPLSGDTLLTAAVLLSVMVLPTVMTLADDALRAVPATQRHAARCLGLNSTETTLYISLPQAWPGLLAALLLGLGRALGETIAVFLVIGRQDNQWPPSLKLLVEAGQTLTTKLGGSEVNIAYGDPLHWAAICGLGLLLLLLAGSITWIGSRLLGDHHGHAA